MDKKKQRTSREVSKMGKRILREMQNGSSGWEKQLADVLDDFDQTTVWRVVGQLMKVGIRTIEAVCEYNVMWKLEDFE